MVRLDTYKAGAYLVWQLRMAGAVIIEDGGDIIQARLPGGAPISLHLIESSIQDYEVRSITAGNHAAGFHTLFLVWADMLLPHEGHVVELQPWEHPLLALYDDCIWAYDVFGGEVFIFPVIYRRLGRLREISYGKTVSLRFLSTHTVESSDRSIPGAWRVVGFGQRTEHAHHRHHYAEQEGPAAPDHIPPDLVACYGLLGVALDAEPEDVKTAYRNLARRLHPDVNAAPDATARMQALNAAYRKVMDEFEE